MIPLGRDMHSINEVLSRVDQIVAMVNDIPDDNFSLDCWTTDDPDCGTIACAVGWAASRGMFGLTFCNHQPVLYWKIVRQARWSHIVPPGALYGMQAACGALFGAITIPDTDDYLPLDITGSLFDTPGGSKYDTVGVRTQSNLSAKQIFLSRVPFVVDAIKQMYHQRELA